MKIITVVGARPQFVKAAAVSRRLASAAGIDEIIVHTGQHFDDNMSAVFFRELGIPEPGYNLGIAGGSHGAMTGSMLRDIERVLTAEKPDAMLVYGDTNSTLAGALAAAKLHLPVAHVEAGLRSFNKRMPEEINRILTDHVAALLLCPTEVAVRNLANEGVTQGVHNVGDVMYDVSLDCARRALAESKILQVLGLTTGQYVLATCHRAENTDDRDRLAAILAGLDAIATETPVVLPIHPRTAASIGAQKLTSGRIMVIEPLPFLDMVRLEQSARVIITDSGGVQKEAYFYGVPCITMRDQTEWTETVEHGWNTLVGADRDAIVCAYRRQSESARPARPPLYGDGDASSRIVALVRAAFAREE